MFFVVKSRNPIEIDLFSKKNLRVSLIFLLILGQDPIFFHRNLRVSLSFPPHFHGKTTIFHGKTTIFHGKTTISWSNPIFSLHFPTTWLFPHPSGMTQALAMVMDWVTTVSKTMGRPVELPSAMAQTVPEKKSLNAGGGTVYTIGQPCENHRKMVV